LPDISPAETITIAISAEAAGIRIDKFLASYIESISRSHLQRAIEDGDVLVNDHTVKSSYKLKAGDVVEIDLAEPPPTEIIPEPIPIEIIYEDEDLVVVNKPAGMVVHPGAGIERGALSNALVYHFNQLSSVAGRIRPGIVHRIDKETSGLLVVAKNDQAHAALADQFRDRKVFKLYSALCYGRVQGEGGKIEARIGRDPRNRTRMAVRSGTTGRAALTLYQVKQRFDEFTLLDVEIKTGRTHQIRVHLAHINHPVVGDKTYGGGRQNSIRNLQLRRAVMRLNRQFLHASQLKFAHPRTGQQMTFTSDLPHGLKELLNLLE